MIPGYIADFVNNRIRRMYAKSGTITMIAGNGLPHRIDVLAGVPPQERPFESQADSKH